MYEISLICPLYNAEKYVLNLYNSIMNQADIYISELKFILTKSEDKTEDILKENNIPYELIEKKDFSHSLIREKEICSAKNKFVILISQDVKLFNIDTFYHMCMYLCENNLAGAYIRQKGFGKGIDKYFREISYSKKSYIYTNADLKTKGQDAIFFSDVCSIYDRDIFIKIGGYDNLNLNTNEDMYYAYKCLKNNYKIGYFADAFVIHSHNFTNQEIKSRYIEIGKFFYKNPEIYHLKSSKFKYFKVYLNILKKFDFISFFIVGFNAMSRIRGSKKGYKIAKKEERKINKG